MMRMGCVRSLSMKYINSIFLFHKMVCWLCDNHTHPDAIQMHEFIVQNSELVTPQSMAVSISKHLHEKISMDNSLPSANSVLIHIERHLLHPKVRVAQMLRNMVELTENIREVMCTRGDDGSALVDVRAASLYIKSVSELMMLYRTSDPTKLLFAAPQ